MSAEAGQRVRQGIQRTEPGKAGAGLVHSSTPLTPGGGGVTGRPRSCLFLGAIDLVPRVPG